jgi:S1-C subfamily serine protease
MTEPFSQLSQALAAVVESARGAVVRVEGRGHVAATGVLWSAEGVIVTAHHVVQRDEDIGVGLADGRTPPAELVGRDPTTDLAVLRVQEAGGNAAVWADDEAVRVGHLVLALGRPGRTVQATLGVVSALGSEWRTPMGGRVDRYLQTDVLMYPGFSGGPLVGAGGEVLGINTSAILRGVSLTIPAATVRRVVETLLRDGRIRRGYLGVGVQPVRVPAALQATLNQETGLLLVSIEPGGPAERGGLLLGDLVVSVDGEPVRQLDDLAVHLSGDRVGSPTAVRVVRGGQLVEQSVVVGERS